MDTDAKKAALDNIGVINETAKELSAEVMSVLYKNNKSANRRARRKSIMLREQVKELRRVLLAIEKEQQ